MVWIYAPLYSCSILQVYMCLQPLNVCMSYQGTLNLVAKLSADHDIEVQFWSDEMKEVFLNSKVITIRISKYYRGLRA